MAKSLHKIYKAGIGIEEKQYEALWSVVKDKKSNDTICVLPTYFEFAVAGSFFGS